MLTLKGYNSVSISDKIELPKIVDLIRMPFYNWVSFEDAYKHGNSDFRNLLDKVPLKNDKKYVTLNCYTHFLTPNVTPAPRGNWHIDVDRTDFKDSNHVHLLLSDCTSVTEFIDKDIILENFDENSSPLEVELYFNRNLLNTITPVKFETSRFMTFDGPYHFHRAVKSKRDEFRFMLRINESNDSPPRKF